MQHRSGISLALAMRCPQDGLAWRLVRSWPEQADTAYVEAVYRSMREGSLTRPQVDDGDARQSQQHTNNP